MPKNAFTLCHIVMNTLYNVLLSDYDISLKKKNTLNVVCFICVIALLLIIVLWNKDF